MPVDLGRLTEEETEALAVDVISMMGTGEALARAIKSALNDSDLDELIEELGYDCDSKSC